MSDNDKIKADIEAKKKRLAELRARKAAASGGSASFKTAVSLKSAGGVTPGRKSSAGPSSAAASVLSQVNKLVGVQDRMLVANYSQAMHDILPQEKHMYDKECQTEMGVKLEGKVADMEKKLREEQAALMQKEEKMKVLMEQLKIDKHKYDQMREEERLNEPKEMTPEEQRQIIGSVEFQNFFTKATRCVERALNQPFYDITRDYADDGDDAGSSADTGLKSSQLFKDKRVTGRAVTSIDWSPKYAELLLASYAGQDDPMSFDPDGTVLVWNMHMANRPEYAFTCNSAVLAACFHPTNNKLIIGACQSGQIVIWDTREKNTPVNRTSLSHSHTYPVYALDTLSVVNNLHNIVSVSTDGHLCVWSDNNLHNPSKEVRLSHGKEEITTTSYDCPKGQNSIILGSDEGFIYKAHVHDNEGIYEAQQAHKAPITNVRCHPSQKNNNLSDLYLTSSFDWTVKLWSAKTDRSLYTFESARDYVLDARWSPIHPALFAMGDGTGKLDVWNLNVDTEVPDLSATVDSTTSTGDQAAINRVAWSDEGTNIAAGTSVGTIHVYSLRADYAQPGPDAAANFYDKVTKRLTSTSD